MALEPRYRARRTRGGPAGTVCGFWRSLTDGSRAALLVFLAVVLACLASAAAAPAYRGAAAERSVLTLPDGVFDAVISMWKSQRLALLDADLDEILRETSGTGARLNKELDQLARESVGSRPTILASLEVLADGPEPGQGEDSGLETKANEMADRYRTPYESYLSRVATIMATVEASTVPDDIALSRKDTIKACEMATSSLLTSMRALDELREGDAPGIATAAETATDATAQLGQAQEQLNRAIRKLER